MIAGLNRPADATVAVFVGGRTGSGVLIDGRHVLTADHVVSGKGDIEVAFPRLRPADESRLPAELLDLGPAAAELDIAVLDLGDSPPEWLCQPILVWPTERLPAELSVFGYPLGERQLRGVWRNSSLAGPLAGRLAQLNWPKDVGSLVGHSGGPVVARGSGALVGVLVQGSKAGFDWMVPVPAVSEVWPGMPRPWFFAGSDDAAGHFYREARGQLKFGYGGDLFRGRDVALRAADDWLTSLSGSGRPLVITGQPGAGKSAVVARIAQCLEDGRMTPGLAFHARGATVSDLVDSVAALCGLDTPASGTELVITLHNLRGDKRRWVLVDALDEAASDQDRRDASDFLRELARLSWLRVAVATRSHAAGDAVGVGRHLNALGVTSREAGNLIDLDLDKYFDQGGLESFAGAVLAEEGVEDPSPAGAAWEGYRSDDALRRRLAKEITTRANRNYLVAAMAAFQLAEDDTILDPDAADFDPGAIPSRVGEALSKYLDQLPAAKQSRAQGLLTALAYARGDGIDDQQWLAFAAALGHPCDSAELQELRHSRAADYLLYSAPGEGQFKTRLFHQALADQLREDRFTQHDEQRLYEALMTQVRTAGWRRAPAYLRMNAAIHAAAAGELDQLVADPQFLLYADPARLSRVLGRVNDRDHPLVRLYWRALDQLGVLTPGQRAAALQVLAARDEAEALPLLQTDADLPWRGMWSSGTPQVFHRRLIGHTDLVRSIAFGMTSRKTLLASGSSDRTVRVWDPVTGEHEATLIGHDAAVGSVAFGNNSLLATSSDDGAVLLWDPIANERRVTLTGFSTPVRSVAFGRIPRSLLVAAGSDNGIVRVWDATTGEEQTTLEGHGGPVHSVAFGQLADGLLLAAGSEDRMVRLWDPVTGEEQVALAGNSPVWSVAFGEVNGCVWVAAGGTDGNVRLWDAATGEGQGTLKGHRSTVWSVAFGQVNGLTLLASGSSDRTIRLWDPVTGEPRATLPGHNGTVWSVAFGQVNGPVLASGSGDRTIRLWGPASGGNQAISAGHSASVRAVAFGRVNGDALLATGSGDRTARLWDPVTGEHRRTLSGHAKRVMSVAFSEPDMRLLATGSTDCTARLWDPTTGEHRATLAGHEAAVRSVAFGQVSDRTMLATGSSDGTARLWDAATYEHRITLSGHRGPIMGLAFGQVDGVAILATGGVDRTARLWNPATGQRRATLTGHDDTVWSVAFGQLGDHGILATGSIDKTARLWDPVTEQQKATLLGHEDTVGAIAFGQIDGRAVLATGSNDRTVRLWDPLTGEHLATITTPGQVWSVAFDQVNDRTLLAMGSPDQTVLVIEVLRFPSPALDTD
jgi:WD40 repeat protein